MLRRLFDELGIPLDYDQKRSLRRYIEARELVEVGPNLIGRIQRLTPRAAECWFGMLAAAGAEDVTLLLVSGFRSIEYQADLIRNKLAEGQKIDDILRVNAAPGFSQHHTGEAIDIATPGSRPLTWEFDRSSAFSWLTKNAEKYGFSLSYPKDNPEGFIYEPWHWSM